MPHTSKSVKTPSIHKIIIEDQTTNNQNEIKQYFRPQTYPAFPISDLLAHPNYKNDQRFYLLLTELKDWNKRIQTNQINKNARAELCRNKFLFTSLKNILVHGSRGATNYETNINKLYQWWRTNSKDQIPLYYTTRRGNNQDDDWQVRKTFKSNMPLQLKNYQRRALFITREDISFFNTDKVKQPILDKLVDYSAIKELNSKQLKQRQWREQQQIENYKGLLKSKRAMFDQNNAKNSQYYRGDFNHLNKTASLFGRQNNKLNVSHIISKSKNSSSFSILQKQNDQIQKVKKYRLNCTIAKNSIIFQQRQPNLNKTTKSFVTLKPFDTSVSDLDQSLMNTQQSALKKQISIKFDKLQGDKSQNTINEEKQNGQQYFIQFNELKNWDGSRLMSNPLEIKKQLKKKKKN